MDFFSFFHSLMRYGVLLTVLLAFVFNLRGWLMRRPILTGERMITIIAMVLCHVQLVIGLVLYALNWGALSSPDAGPYQRFIKYEHAGSMLIAIALITVGRSLSKRANEESTKQRHVAIFYGIGLVLMFWATPWPFKEVAMGMGWL